MLVVAMPVFRMVLWPEFPVRRAALVGWREAVAGLRSAMLGIL